MKKVGLLFFFCFIFTGMVFAQCSENSCSGCPSAETCGVEMVASDTTGKTIAAAKTITVGELAKMIEDKKTLSIIDARSAKFDDGKRIPGAKTLTDASPVEEIKKMLPQQDAMVVTYCANPKCPASPKLAAKLKELGYSNVLELPDGIEGWEKAGKPIEKATPAVPAP